MMSLAEKNPNVDLTERDRDLLTALYTLRFLSTSQIQRLFYPGVKTNGYITARMNLLKNNKYLMMENLSTRKNRVENHYFLARKGIDLAAPEVLDNLFNERGKKLYFTAKENYIDPTQQLHQLKINELLVRLYLKVNDASTVTDFIKRYWKETRNAITKVGEDTIKPDAKLTLDDTTYWIEVDRGSESLTQIRTKIKRYESLAIQESGIRQKNVMFFFCENGQNLSPKSFQKRILDIKKIALERLGESLDAEFDLYIGEYEVLSQYLISNIIGQVEPTEKMRLQLQQWARNFNYEHKVRAFTESELPIKNSWVPFAWFQYQAKGNPAVHWFITEFLSGNKMSCLRSLKRVYAYCLEFERQTKIPLRCLIQGSEEDLTMINHLYPDLKKVSYFTTKERWQQQENYFAWERGRLGKEGVLR